MSRREHFEIKGSCHCGNIRLVLLWPGGETEMGVRICGCTFCRKHAGAWTSHRDAALNVQIVNKSRVAKYQFGTKTADFYVCSACGVVPFVLSEIGGKNYAVVNVNSLHDIDRLSTSRSKTDFDGEGKGDRLSRRRQNWIPKVVIDSNIRRRAAT